MLTMIPGYKYIPNQHNKQIKQFISDFDKIIEDIIQKKQERTDATSIDMLDLMMQNSDETGKKFTPKQLRDNLITFMLAG